MSMRIKKANILRFIKFHVASLLLLFKGTETAPYSEKLYKG